MTVPREGAPPDGTPPGPPPPGQAAYFVSGLVYQTLRPGDGGRHPGPADEVRASWRGWSGEGRPVEEMRGEMPVAIADLPAGLAEALQAMTPGERGRAWVPPRLAGAGARGTTVYEIELMEITRAGPRHEVPPDLRAPRLDEVQHGDPSS